MAAQDAVRRARQVVGLYGDPDVSWSIVLAVHVPVPLGADNVRARLGDLAREHEHLGAPTELVRFAEDGREAVLAALADDEYGDHDPLLRCALSEDGRQLLLGAHHGAVDGLGLLGAAARVSGLPLASNAQGVAADAEPRSFVAGSIRRLWEAVVHPPTRLGAQRRPDRGDWLRSSSVSGGRAGSDALVLAASSVVRAWNDGEPARGLRTVVAMGLSRRAGTPPPPPDRDTAYSRIVVDDVRTRAAAALAVRSTAPEPAFPVTDGGGLGPRAARLLSSRLGSTLLVSNLGLVRGAGVERLEFWPVPTGPAGCCLGLVSTETETVVTVRARRSWFDGADADRLAGLVADELTRACAQSQ